MIEFFVYIQVLINICGCALCAIASIKRQASGDSITILSIISIAALIVQGIFFAIAPIIGQISPRGDALELALYYIFALIICVAGFVWTLINRTVSSVILMGFIFFALIVMHIRMRVIWG